MSAKTKIIVLRMKELIYTGIFIALGLLLIILLIVVFSPKKREEAASPTQEPTYVPGIYTTSLMLNDLCSNRPLMIWQIRSCATSPSVILPIRMTINIPRWYYWMRLRPRLARQNLPPLLPNDLT